MPVSSTLPEPFGSRCSTLPADGDLLLLYAARDVEHNNAVALRDYLRNTTDPGATE